MSLFRFFKTPFPRPAYSKKNVFWLLAVSFICNIFILLFKPYDIENQTGAFYGYLLLFSLGIVFFVSVYLMEFLVPSLFPKSFKKWTLGKAILWYAWVISFVAATMFLYKSFLGGFRDFTFYEYLMVMMRVLSIAITVSFFVLGISSYLNKKQISLLSSNQSFVITNASATPIRLHLKEVMYIVSDDNYVDIHLLSNNERKKEVVRSSLKNIEAQIVNPVSPMHRCHRQYIININYFKIKKKTSRSMTILLKNDEDEIPVSKQYAEKINQLLHTRP